LSEFSRNYGGSPVFRTAIGALAASGSPGDSVVIDYESDTFNGKAGSAKRFTPLDSVRISNGSTYALDVYFNQSSDNVRHILGSQEITLTNQNIRSLRVVNLGSGALGATDAYAEAWKELFDSQDAISGIVKKAAQAGLI
jgi:hypothetical protein